ncbi:hypothetical protein [Pelagicoccus sp. SDUM812002]|uniref:hypothetical protein n=1 Tax=Pelagicoccus sp. SDUM812002 TaxID=3041266 RepID=UPI00280F9A66|nr:hypothetical protein [Pelagicoccus sp. SDUM812002]MDQ8184984.1 hypothetical protein [Pelagicoccus sp. SDUM812002]
MNTLTTTKIIEATVAAVVILAGAALIIPAVGVLAAVGLVAGGLATMAALETKERAY